MTRTEQHGNHDYPEHLTMEQLSAFLDKQLPPSEQAFFDAHLQSCEQCRLALADLRTTVALVRAMPQPALPRSFTLPANVTPFPIQAAREERQLHRPAGRQSARRNALRRTTRFASAIAAVLGLLFILSGLLPALSAGHGTLGGASESSAPVSAPNQGAHQSPAVSGRATTPGIATPGIAGTQSLGPTQTQKIGQGAQPAATPAAKTSPQSTPQNRTALPQAQTPVSPALPPYLDPGTILGRLSLGLALALLGVIGLLATRRRYRQARY